MVLRIGIAGVGGRMGREVAAAAVADAGVVLVGGTVRPGSLPAGLDAAATAGVTGPAVRIVERPEDLVDAVDVIVDFTRPEATLSHARACAEAGHAFVTGTTGLSPHQRNELLALSEMIPIFYARNMSLGLNALLSILPALVRALDGYDVEIVEAHHRHKADAPSGTALALAEAIAAASGGDLAGRTAHGRHGLSPRQPGEIGIHAVRAGGNAGEHTVLFADDGEQIQVIHRAYARRTFALGALRAAKFVAGRRSGLYGMTDLLGMDA